MLGIHTEETRIERDTCTPMFITTLFKIARTWKQPRCPSAGEWIRKLCYIYIKKECSKISKYCSDAGRDWGQEEKGTIEDEMAGWHHRLDGCESE